MPPKFSFQTILDFHHSRVEVLEVDLAQLKKKLQEGEMLLEYLYDEVDRLHIELTESQNGEMDLSAIAQTRANIKHTEKRIKRQIEEMKKLANEIEKKRLELVAAKQDEAAFEKLKEKQLETYYEKVNEQEKILQDDIYIANGYKASASHG